MPLGWQTLRKCALGRARMNAKVLLEYRSSWTFKDIRWCNTLLVLSNSMTSAVSKRHPFRSGKFQVFLMLIITHCLLENALDFGEPISRPLLPPPAFACHKISGDNHRIHEAWKKVFFFASSLSLSRRFPIPKSEWLLCIRESPFDDVEIWFSSAENYSSNVSERDEICFRAWVDGTEALSS